MATLTCSNCHRDFEHNGKRGPKPKKCPDCSNRYGTRIEVSITQIQLNKAKRSWSKYGGAKHGLEREQQSEWTCQTCGTTHDVEMPAFMIPMDSNRTEFLKICGICMNIWINNKLKKWQDLIKIAQRGRR